MSRNSSAVRSHAQYSVRETHAARVRETEAACDAATAVLSALPEADNSPGAVERMLRANGILRNLPWPPPFDQTRHRLRIGDARDLSWLDDASIHLVVTSPPHWTLKDYQPGAIIKNDVEYILFLRKGGEYRSPSAFQRVLSMLTKEEMQSWTRSTWSDVRGESTRKGHPAPFPIALAERLIKMFSFAGDTVLDPFSGTGSTSLAALETGRHSIGNEIEPMCHRLAAQRLEEAAWLPRSVGAVHATVELQ